MGDTSQGYKIQHSLQFTGLIPGRKYTVQYLVSHTVSANGGVVTAMNVRRTGSKLTSQMNVGPITSTAANRLSPQYVTITFKATTRAMCYRVCLSAEGPFNGLRLQAGE